MQFKVYILLKPHNRPCTYLLTLVGVRETFPPVNHIVDSVTLFCHITFSLKERIFTLTQTAIFKFLQNRTSKETVYDTLDLSYSL